MASSDPASALPLSLPIATSSAGLQGAQIASLTTQMEQLVRKNEALTRQYENDKRKLEMALESEQKRAHDAVSKMMKASKLEVSEWEANCEKLRSAANFALLDARHFNQVTQRDVRALRIQVNQLLTQLKVKDYALIRSRNAQEDLQERLEQSEEVYIRHLEEITASYEDALASATSSNTGNTKHLNQLGDQLSTAKQLKDRAESEAVELKKQVTQLDEDNADQKTKIERLELEMKGLRLELDDSRKENRELKDQVASWKRLEGKEVDDVKEARKRVKEMESQLKAAKSEIEELKSANAEMKENHATLEEQNSRMKAEMKQLKKTNKDLKASTAASDDERPLKDSRKDKEDQPAVLKSKKRAREDANDGVDNMPVEVKRPAKKVKGEEEVAKPKARKPPASVKASKSKVVRPPSPSPPPRSPTPMSDPSPASSDVESKPVVKSSNAPSKPIRPWQKNLKLDKDQPLSKSKAVSSLSRDDDEEEEDVIIAGAVGKSVAAPRKARNEDDAPIKSKKERPVKNDGDKKRVTSGAKSKSKAAVNLDDEEPETFNLNGVHASDSESADDHVLKVKNKDEKVKAKKKDAKAEKPKADVRKADKVAGSSTMAANEAPAKPKKRTMNLLGGVMGGTGTGALGDWWNSGTVPNSYGIPAALSSPEKSTSQNVPRARFEFGKGY